MPYVLIDQQPPASEHQVPLRDRFALHDGLIGREQRLLSKDKALVSALTELNDAYRREVVALVGEEVFRANSERHRQTCRGFATLRDRHAHTPDGERARQDERRRLRQAKHEFYHGLGIDIARVRAIRKESLAQARAVARQHIDLELEAPAAGDARPPGPTTNPWTWYTPAYAYQWGSIPSAGGSAGTSWKSAQAWATTGEINLMSWIELFGASDKDWRKTDAMCEVGVWFQLPAAGVIEAWAWFQDINTEYSGLLEDESGCSDAYVRQLSRLYLWTTDSTERYVTVKDYERGESEGQWTDSLTAPGFIRPVRFFSQKAYAAGQWVYAAFGVRDFNLFQVDDMTCRSRMYSQYFVKQLALRSTGAP